mgnify:FL=1
MNNTKSVEPKILGSLLGGAVGDALGLPVEFMKLSEIRRVFGPGGVTGYADDPIHHSPFTDDTQMTLWTAEGLIMARPRSRNSDSDDWDLVRAVNGSYMRWFLTQKSGVPPVWSESADEPFESGWLIQEPGIWARVAPGSTCLSALRVGGLGTRANPINDSKGCGGVMRVAPVGLIGLGEVEAYELGCDVAALTHGHPAGYVAAGALALILDRLVGGDQLESAVAEAIDVVDHDDPEAKICGDSMRRAVALAEAGNPSVQDVERLGGGWVAEDALAIAVYCALVGHDFREAVLLAVNHSGDSDSTASITGQILGAIGGVDVIPNEWLEGLGQRSLVERIAGDLHDAFYEDRVFPAAEYPAW